MAPRNSGQRTTVLTVFGTRPEAIKLAPVIHELEKRSGVFRCVNVITAQHTDMLDPFLRLFDIRVDHNLSAMRHGQGLNLLCSRIISAIDPLLEKEAPDLVVLQGDTTSALAGGLAAFHRKIPVAHVEAGLRSDNLHSPFPEEFNRRLVSTFADLHLAPTEHNVQTLRSEGIDEVAIVQTGNPVVDAVHWVIDARRPSSQIEQLLEGLAKHRIILLTTHRRENFGAVMRGQLTALREFVDRHGDIALVFPVHLNPAVREAALPILSDQPRIKLIEPLEYPDFLHIMSRAWLVVSDSGGVQEEAPSLGKAVLILRENTERPEAVECGVARLVGNSADNLSSMLEEALRDDSWIHTVTQIENPFGRGDSAKRIVDAIARHAALHESSRV